RPSGDPLPRSSFDRFESRCVPAIAPDRAEMAAGPQPRPASASAGKWQKQFSWGLLSSANGHQTEMQHEPNRHREQCDRSQSFPGPRQMVSLNRINGDHEIIAEPGPAKE